MPGNVHYWNMMKVYYCDSDMHRSNRGKAKKKIEHTYTSNNIPAFTEVSVSLVIKTLPHRILTTYTFEGIIYDLTSYSKKRVVNMSSELVCWPILLPF